MCVCVCIKIINIQNWLTCNSGNASDSNDAKSTLYFPTVGHLKDSGLR